MARTVHCVKLGREAEGMATPPLPGALGQKLYDSVSAEAWQMWVKTQTMIINEHRLNLSDPDSRRYLQEQMKQYFFGEGA